MSPSRPAFLSSPPSFSALRPAPCPNSSTHPGATTSAFIEDAGHVLGIGGLGQAEAAERARFLATGDALPPATLALLEGHSVAVEPVENSIVYAYPQLHWDPEPVLQSYSAYTSYLDRLDAAFLASTRAPQRILYQPWVVIDGRDAFFDPPSTVESMYCHYFQVPAPGPALVLERGSRPLWPAGGGEKSQRPLWFSRRCATQAGGNGRGHVFVGGAPRHQIGGHLAETAHHERDHMDRRCLDPPRTGSSPGRPPTTTSCRRPRRLGTRPPLPRLTYEGSPFQAGAGHLDRDVLPSLFTPSRFGPGEAAPRLVHFYPENG